jgi:hypothetical protein
VEWKKQAGHEVGAEIKRAGTNPALRGEKKTLKREP